jgi:tRNA (cmo5U34)-methyltransferase
MEPNVNLWDSPTHALEYLARADRIPYRGEGERTLLECLPASIGRVLDLGSGDGRLLSLVRLARPVMEAVAIDFSETMLDRLRERFAEDPRVRVLAHDLSEPLPDASALGRFDAIVSSFAIHHLTHPRKRELYTEIHRLLSPGGVFLNLEHVSSATASLHHQFLASMNVTPEDEDPSNKLLDVETQLRWMREIGFADVDCLWKWRELALLAAKR